MFRKFLFATAVVLAATGLHAETTMGDDGLFKSDWQHDTFKDLREDLAEANDAGKRFVVMIEQRGCIYCRRMHEEVFVVPEIEMMLSEDFFVIQINMFGDVEVTDFDGEVLTEKEMVLKWGAMFTPTILFFPDHDVPEEPASDVAVAYIPGALSRGMTFNMLNWVLEHGYDSGENFQKYHARMLAEGRGSD